MAESVQNTSEYKLDDVPCSETGVSTNDDDLFEFTCYGAASVVGLCGIVGNVISIIILTRPQMKSLLNYLLTVLAASDMIIILYTILACFLPAVCRYIRTPVLFYYFYNYNAYVLVSFYPVAMIAQTATVYLTLTVTLERYMAVFHPLQARRLCTHRRARAYTIGVIIFAVLYNLSRFCEYDVYTEEDTFWNMTFHGYKASALRNDQLYVQYYYNWSYLIFMFLLPLISIAILNAAIYIQIKRANKVRQTLTNFQENEIRLAFMLLCVVLVFLLCHLLTVVIRMCVCFEWKTFLGISITGRLAVLNNALVTFNSSVNFILYVIFGEKFKKMVFKMFCSYRRPSWYRQPG